VSIPRWKIVVYGLFVGVSISSLVLFAFRLIPISKGLMISILYFYPFVGGLTAYVTYKKLGFNSPGAQKIERIDIEREKSGNKTKKIKIENYKEKLERINSLKRTSLILKSLIKTKKELEKLKKESNSILEDTVERMDNKTLKLTKEYLK
jgi:hypothetical protein